MNLGIVGNGFIVKYLLDELKNIESIKVNSILVREESIQKGKELSEKYRIKNIFTRLDKFLEDKKIDTVYIGIINSLHYDYAKKCLERGKHVICEKPFTQTKKQAEELFEIAERNNVFIFEAITTIHLPTYKKVKENLNQVGKLRIINCSFTQYSSRYDNYLKGNIAPVFQKELFGGALVDLNVYNVHFVVSLFGVPEKVSYFPNLDKNGVDTSGILLLEYIDFKAVCIGAKDSQSESFGTIQGEKGYIKISSSLNDCESCHIVSKEGEVTYKQDKSYGRMYYEFVEFDRIIASSDYKAYKNLLNETLNVMDVIEKAYNVMK